MGIIEPMTMRELRSTRKLEAKLQAGKIIELRKRNRPFARIMPLTEPEQPKKIEWPDFEARARKIFGDRILPGADLLIEERRRD
jgi:antitoxin (DNA-binding transcriptional repressor) of toxin-antitoxin stability system